MSPQLKSAILQCLRCQSELRLKGQYAQRIAEHGVCPICHTLGMLTMKSMTV
jgi:hypothetical protein